MRNLKQRVIFSLLVFSICYDESIAADSPCGDWEPYKDEKCFKLFDSVGLQTYDNAVKTCQQQENSSTVISIHHMEEQEFFSNFLFKTNKVVDAVWIGAKYTSNKYNWADDSDLGFTNWAEGSPSNTTDKACVQMIAEGSSMGKWITEPCNKSNKVVCQKMQTWSFSRLQKTLLDARKELQDSLENVTKQLNNQQTTINNLKQNPVPIGFIYVQLPNEKSPTEIWPWMTWNDMSSAYAGVFFRVTGGEAASFGQVQGDNSPRLSKAAYLDQDGTQGHNEIVVPREGWSEPIYLAGLSGPWSWMKFYMSGGEVRPRNMAIRVWKRAG